MSNQQQSNGRSARWRAAVFGVAILSVNWLGLAFPFDVTPRKAESGIELFLSLGRMFEVIVTESNLAEKSFVAAFLLPTPLVLVGTWCLFVRRTIVAGVVGIIAAICVTYLVASIPDPTRLGFGFYTWSASIALLIGFSLLDWWLTRDEKRANHETR